MTRMSRKCSVVAALALAMLFVCQALGAGSAVADEGIERPPVPPGMEPYQPPAAPAPVPECVEDPPIAISGYVSGPDGAVQGALVIVESNQSTNTTFTDDTGNYSLDLNFNYSDDFGVLINVSAFKGGLGAKYSGIAVWPSITIDLAMSERAEPLPESGETYLSNIGYPTQYSHMGGADTLSGQSTPESPSVEIQPVPDMPTSIPGTSTTTTVCALLRDRLAEYIEGKMDKGEFDALVECILKKKIDPYSTADGVLKKL